MRRTIIVLAMLVSSFGFISAASPATAGAANCTAITFNYAGPGGQGPIWWDGSFAWQPIVGSCTGVSHIHITEWWSAGGGAPPFLYDFTHAVYHLATSGGGYCGTGNTLIPSCTTTYHTPTWGGGCGQPTFYTRAYFRYQIQNGIGGPWGPYHDVYSAGQNLC